MQSSSKIRVGSNASSFATRVLMLGYYDCATDGVIEFGSIRETYQFRWTDADHPAADTLHRRTFTLHPMPADSLERLSNVLTPYIKPAWPAWFPIWRFPSESIQQDVEAETDAILAEAGPATWQIETEDVFNFSHFTATRLLAEPAV